MIHVDRKETILKGTSANLYAEIGVLLRHCYQNGILSREELLQLVDVACMTKEEIHAETLKELDKLSKRLDSLKGDISKEAFDELQAINDLFSDILGDSDE